MIRLKSLLREASSGKFVAVQFGRTGPNDKQWSIHRTNCKDVNKEMNRRDGFVMGYADTLKDAMDVILDPQTREMGWDEKEVKVHNCAKVA